MRLLKPRRPGFSLMEFMLAVAILAMMGGITWGAIARFFDGYETVTRVDARYHNIRVAMNRMATEISMAFITSNRRHKGRERIWQTVFKKEDESPFPVLHFTAFAHQKLRANAKESDQAEISYFGARDPDESDQLNLMRRVDPIMDQEPDKGGRAQILAEDIKDFEIKFYDPKDDDWGDEWDTEKIEFAGRLPPMVEILLTIEGEDGKDITFTTKTRINLVQELGTL